jgi:AraC-like DNA-binding protein
MIFNFEERPSDSPFVEVVWRDHCEGEGPFISMATSHWQLVVTRDESGTRCIVRGPETRATPAYAPSGVEHFGIYFKPGVVMPQFPASQIRDGLVELPEARSGSFWLHGSAWQAPDFENVDTFVNRLVHEGLLVRDLVVEAALRPEAQGLSARSIQRRFLRATGLTRGALAQIDRARHAAILLRQGVSIADTVDLAGYSDQPHLTRSLKHYTGQTPAQLLRKNRTDQLSFLAGLNETS